jgi:hypothetical protein
MKMKKPRLHNNASAIDKLFIRKIYTIGDCSVRLKKLLIYASNLRENETKSVKKLAHFPCQAFASFLSSKK